MASDDLNTGASGADSTRPPIDSEDLFGFGNFGAPDDLGDDIDLDGWGGAIDDVGSVLEDILGDREDPTPLDLLDEMPSALPVGNEVEDLERDQGTREEPTEEGSEASQETPQEASEEKPSAEATATPSPLHNADAPPVDGDDLFGFEEVETSPEDAIADFGDILGDDLITDFSQPGESGEQVPDDVIESLLEGQGAEDSLDDLIEEAEALSSTESPEPSTPNTADVTISDRGTDNVKPEPSQAKSPTPDKTPSEALSSGAGESPDPASAETKKGPSILDRLPRQVPAFLKERPALVLAAVALLLFQVNWITGVRSSLEEMRTLVVSAMESSDPGDPRPADRSTSRRTPDVVSDPGTESAPAEQLPDPQLTAAWDELDLAHRLALSGAYVEARRRIAGLLAVVDQLQPEDREEIEVQALLQMAEAFSGEAKDLEVSDS